MAQKREQILGQVGSHVITRAASMIPGRPDTYRVSPQGSRLGSVLFDTELNAVMAAALLTYGEDAVATWAREIVRAKLIQSEREVA